MLALFRAHGMALARAAADEDLGHLVLQQMRALLFHDGEIQRAIGRERRVRGGDKAVQGVRVFHGFSLLG